MRDQVPYTDKNDNKRPKCRKNLADIKPAQISKQKQNTDQDNQ
jgi:hypothetical protein